MKPFSLQAIRRRVERLAEACVPPQNEVLLIRCRWRTATDHCPTCGYNLDAHAQREALATHAATGDTRPVQTVVYWWPETITICPHCATPVPDEAIYGPKLIGAGHKPTVRP